MKKLIASILALACVLGFVGCAAEKHENETHNSNTEQQVVEDNKDNVPIETTEDLSEIPGGTRFIVEIRDREEEEHLVCAEAVELFYEDETTCYFFNVIKSHYVIVTYNNGNSENIVSALNAGRATIADLDKFGIEYHTEPKK